MSSRPVAPSQETDLGQPGISQCLCGRTDVLLVAFFHHGGTASSSELLSISHQHQHGKPCCMASTIQLISIHAHRSAAPPSLGTIHFIDNQRSAHNNNHAHHSPLSSCSACLWIRSLSVCLSGHPGVPISRCE